MKRAPSEFFIGIVLIACLISAIAIPFAFAEGEAIAPTSDRLTQAPQGFAYAPLCIWSNGTCVAEIYEDGGAPRWLITPLGTQLFARLFWTVTPQSRRPSER